MTSPDSTQLFGGAIAGIDPINQLASPITTQCNGDTMTRRLSTQTATAESSSRSGVTRLEGSLQASIRLEVAIDAANHPEQARFSTSALAVYPAAAASGPCQSRLRQLRRTRVPDAMPCHILQSNRKTTCRRKYMQKPRNSRNWDRLVSIAHSPHCGSTAE
jgi:hypothetical protein